jgi:uncharacterized membrane protein
MSEDIKVWKELERNTTERREEDKGIKQIKERNKEGERLTVLFTNLTNTFKIKVIKLLTDGIVCLLLGWLIIKLLLLLLLLLLHALAFKPT